MINPFDTVDDPLVSDSVAALYQWAFEFGHNPLYKKRIVGSLNDALHWKDCAELGILEYVDEMDIRLREGFQDRIQEVLDKEGIKL